MTFGEAIKGQPTPDRAREAIRVELIQRIQGARFFLTPILMEAEPYRTHALEAIDGVKVVAGVPKYGAVPSLHDMLSSTRLIALEHDKEKGVRYTGHGKIMIRRKRQEIIPGTSTTREMVTDEDLGTDVSLPHLQARDVLVKQGWPIRDEKSQGRARGTVVEWDWLVAEAARPETSQAVRDIYAAIKAAMQQKEPQAALAAVDNRKRGGADARP